MTESKNDYFNFLLVLADSSLILGQRLSEWCGHGPVLEQDIALTNIALDCIGQARLIYQYAADFEGAEKEEDDLAYLRDVRNYRNLLLCERPNGDFAHTLVRQYIFDCWQLNYYQTLAATPDDRLKAIVGKSLKEISYHYTFSSEWVKRLGLGTEESNQRMQAAAEEMWRFAGEGFIPAVFEKRLIEKNLIPDPAELREKVLDQMAEHFEIANLKVERKAYMHSGGKEGLHSENLGFILSDLQYMQRAYPGAKW